MYPTSQFQASFFKKQQLAQNTYSFYFRHTIADFTFYPGQYIRMTLPITSTDGRGISRFFTICSSPLQKDILMITTKFGPSDFKKALVHLEHDSKVQFFGPIGGFYLREEDVHTHVFLAGGIGITPFHSMISYAAEKKLSIPMTLFVSFSTPEEMIFYEDLLSIEKENHNIKIVYTITRPEQSEQIWHGETGRISEMLIKKYLPEFSKHTYYVVGPPAMVDGTEQLLQNMGIPANQVKIEQFTGYV